MHVCHQVWTCWWARRTVWSCWTVVVRARFTPSSTPAGSNRWTSWRASTCSSPYQVINAALCQSALTTVSWSCLFIWHKITVFNGMPNTRCQIVLMLSDYLFSVIFFYLVFSNWLQNHWIGSVEFGDVTGWHFWTNTSASEYHHVKLQLKLSAIVIN